jgi:hypothetical protein
MENNPLHKAHFESDDINEKIRKDIMRGLEPYGSKQVAELSDMSDGERAKWLFWNLHENLDAIRLLEPTLIGQVMSTQLTVSDGQSMWTDKHGLEKRIELNCKWQLGLTYSVYQNEKTYEMGEGWVNLFIGDTPPFHPILLKNQKGYLNMDSSLFPNQLSIYGWITESVWQEIKPQLYNGNPTCRTDILLMDNSMFPIKTGFDFVTGPAGSIGLTNLEFRTFSHPTERRMTRRNEPRQRS